LENVFIHDINNLLTGLRGWSDILTRRPQDALTIAQRIVSLSSHLTQEVQNQQFMMLAERGELKVANEPVGVNIILEGIKTFFSGYPVENVSRLDIIDRHDEITLHSCQPLLTRVLANMVKNAMEAALPPEKIRVWFEFCEGQPGFFVHNPGEIPDEIAAQIFKRSFSTKNTSGRGLGTYSMKLFGEQYLGGEVGFTSNKSDGTTFFIKFAVDQYSYMSTRT